MTSTTDLLLLAVFVMQFLQTVVAMQILHAIRGSR